MRKPCCEKEGINKGAWSKQEDQRLIDYIKTHGEGCWRSLPKAAGLQRCGKSCRLRWINYLRPDIKRGNFAQDEEDLIIKLHALLGNRWSLIAGRLPGRTDNEVKNYWNSHIRKKLVRMGIDPNNHKPHQHLLNPLIISTNQNVNNNNTITTTTTTTPLPPNQHHHHLRPVGAPSHGSHQVDADADADADDSSSSSSAADSMDNNIAATSINVSCSPVRVFSHRDVVISRRCIEHDATSRTPAAASSCFHQADHLNLNLTINSKPTSPRSLVLLDKEDQLQLGAGTNYLQNKIITNYEYPSNKVVSSSEFDVEVDSSPTLLLFR